MTRARPRTAARRGGVVSDLPALPSSASSSPWDTAIDAADPWCPAEPNEMAFPDPAGLPAGTVGPDDAAFAEDAGPGIPPLLSVVEVAALFNRSARTLRRWERTGALIPIRIGCSVFYRADDIRDLVAGRLADRIDRHVDRKAVHPTAASGVGSSDKSLQSKEEYPDS